MSDPTAPATSRTRRAVATVWRAATRLMLTLAVVTFLAVALGPHLLGYRTATMLTGSMAPQINPGDAIVSFPKPAAEVAVGDVLTYQIPVEDHRVETHRVIKVTRDSAGRLAIVTKGDANTGPDPWVAVLQGDTVWQTQTVIPHAGTVIRVLRQPFVQRYVFWGALAGMVLALLTRIWARPGPAGAPLDAAVFDVLADELDSREAALGIASTYLELLDARVERIDHAVQDWQAEEALEAALSLTVTSATVGAERLAEQARTVVDAVCCGDRSAARTAASSLRQAAAETAAAFRDLLGSPRTRGPVLRVGT